jgi:hypothetical protein
MSAKNAHGFEGIEPRTVRAAREAMAVDAYAYGEGSGMFDVYSVSDNTYTVSLRDPLGCTCPDFQRRGDQLCDSDASTFAASGWRWGSIRFPRNSKARSTGRSP